MTPAAPRPATPSRGTGGGPLAIPAGVPSLTGLLDSALREITGAPVRVRVALRLPLAFGWAERIRVVIPGLVVAGLRVEEVDARLNGARIVPGVPPHLRIDLVHVRVRVEEGALDDWARSVALPLRIRLRRGVIEARTGLAGVRLGGVHVDLALDQRGRLRVAPKRVTVLGLGLASGAIPAVALPLPPLPRRARLVELRPDDGAASLAFEVAGIDEPLTPGRVADLVKAGRAALGRPARGAGRAQPVTGRNTGSRRPSSSDTDQSTSTR